MLRLVFHPKVWRALIVLLVYVCGVPLALIVNYKWLFHSDSALFYIGWTQQARRFIREG